MGLRTLGAYSIPCDYDQVYIRQTGHLIDTSLKEQSAKPTRTLGQVATAEHISLGQSIFFTKPRYVDHIIREVTEIQLHPNMNSEDSFCRSKSWKPLFCSDRSEVSFLIRISTWVPIWATQARALTLHSLHSHDLCCHSFLSWLPSTISTLCVPHHMPTAHVYDFLPTLFNYLPTTHTYMIVNDQTGRLQEIMPAAYFKVLQQHIPSKTEEIQANP